MAYEDAIDTEAVFDPVTAGMIQNVAATHSIPAGYLLPPLLAAAAHLSNKSRINAWRSYCEPASLYTMTCGFTSTNKSCALGLVSDAVREVEIGRGVEMNKSRLNQCKKLNIHHP